MKKLKWILFLFPVVLHAQLPTTDVAAQAAIQQSNAQRMVEHGENISKWLESIQKAQEQLQKAQEGVQLLTDVKGVMGDPTKVVSLLSNNLGSPGIGEVGKTFSEIGKTASQASSLGDDIKGLYSPIAFAKPEDFVKGIDTSSHDPMAQFNNVENLFSNYGTELQRSEREAAAIRGEIDKINQRTASTQAEQSQKQADLLAAQTKLADAKKRSDEAYQKFQAMKTLNDSMRDKMDEQSWKVLHQQDKEVTKALNKLDQQRRWK
jgi:hypothetical protein